MKRGDDDIDERRQNLALFRHAVIGELDIEKMEPGERTERIRMLAARVWQLPSGQENREYLKLFEALPTMLAFDRLRFVHGGIPRDQTTSERWVDLSSLNDPELRFQMLWSDPSEAETVPAELQKASSRFAFGVKQLRHFLARNGCTTLVRGHDRIVEGFRRVYDANDATLLSLFSAGGATNADLPASCNYREVTPMALTIRHCDGESVVTPFAIDWQRFNEPKRNGFLG